MPERAPVSETGASDQFRHSAVDGVGLDVERSPASQGQPQAHANARCQEGDGRGRESNSSYGRHKPACYHCTTPAVTVSESLSVCTDPSQ